MKLALFAGLNYYPRPGVDDFRGFGDLEELKALYTSKIEEWTRTGPYPDWWGQIVDPETMAIVSACVDREPWEDQ
jgi:hypothetical protein